MHELLIAGVRVGLHLVAIIFSVGFVLSMINRIPWPVRKSVEAKPESLKRGRVDWSQVRDFKPTPKRIFLLACSVIVIAATVIVTVSMLQLLDQFMPVKILLPMMLGALFFAVLYIVFPQVNWEFVFFKSAIIGSVIYIWAFAMAYSAFFYAIGDTRMLWGLAIASGWLSKYLLDQFMLFIDRSAVDFDKLADSVWARLPQLINRGRTMFSLVAKKS